MESVGVIYFEGDEHWELLSEVFQCKVEKGVFGAGLAHVEEVLFLFELDGVSKRPFGRDSVRIKVNN